MSESKQAAKQALLAIASTIKDLGEVPSGHLYAALMDKMSLEAYDLLIEVLVRNKVIRKEPSHLLVWVG